jgi:hypothetical protein
VNYTVRKSDNGNKWEVIENKTELIIASNRNQQIINSIAKKLNRGAGFNGDTPPFFAIAK